MDAVQIMGHVDDEHRLVLDVPDCITAGPVTVLILPSPQEGDAADAWMAGIAREWADDLADERQDIYSL